MVVVLQKRQRIIYGPFSATLMSKMKAAWYSVAEKVNGVSSMTRAVK